MKVELEDVSSIRKKLTIEIPEAEVNAAVKESYETLRAQVEIEGFRKGRAPAAVLRQKYSDKVIEDVGTKLMESSYPAALEEKGVKPAGKPEIEVTSLSEGMPFIFTAFVEVLPTVDKIDGYKELELERKSSDATPEEVAESLEAVRQSKGEFVEAEKTAEKTDTVIIDFDCRVNGQVIKGVSQKDYSFIVDGGAKYSEFEEAVTGLKAGEKSEFEKSFPPAYHDSALAGKTANFEVVLKTVKEKKLPEIDDAFAKDLGFDDLPKLKEKVVEELSKGKQQSETDRLKGEVIEQLIAKNDFEVPHSVVDRYFSQIAKSVLNGLRQGLANPRDVNVSSDEFKSRYMEMAAKHAKGDLMIDVIAKSEGVVVTDADVERVMQEMATAQNQPLEAVKEAFDKSEGSTDGIKSGIKHDKVFEFIFNANNVGV
ncbi:MAG: trigger factor [Deltaproteobacteria bacterium]|nr:trigger factor [Deltaproteobacteria bacterium]